MTVSPSIVSALPPAVLSLVQENLIERAFHDGLYPAMQYRAEAMAEEWAANTGTEMFMTRPGLLRPVVKPLAPAQDPQPQQVSYEQWSAVLQRFAGTIDTHMPSSAVANSNLFVRNVHQLGLQAGQSLNRIPRDSLFKAYLSGQTATTAATAAIDTTIRVAALNGFTSVVGGTVVRPTAISASTPLQIQIGATGSPGTITRNAVGFAADNPNDLFGPGTLTLSAAVGAIFAARTPVLASNRPAIVRAGGGDSIDALGPADTFTLQDAINAAGILRQNNVQPHADGFYHAHISAISNTQVFTDPVWQRLNTALPDHVIYKQGFIGIIGGIMFFMNTESPDNTNCGALTLTGTNAQYAEDIGAEVVNDSGIKVARILVTGKAPLYEKWLDESAYVSEAGITGKIGEFDVVNNGLSITLERIRLILRAPIDRLGDLVAASWSISTCFPVPTDITATSSPSLYKRAICLESSM